MTMKVAAGGNVFIKEPSKIIADNIRLDISC